MKYTFLLFVIVTTFIVASQVSLPKTQYETLPIPTSSPQIPTPSPALSPSPTPRPLTFSEMQEKFGPCTYLPVIIYHHVQDQGVAQKNGQVALTIDTNNFRAQMQNLKARNLVTFSPQDLINFFDKNIGIPSKGVILTFDDAYEDFYFNAYPILRELNLQATLFVPTGLVENKGYLNWNEISEMSGSGLIYFANHTWSHKSVASSADVVEKEIITADIQLSERGLNLLKVFAYPYGSENATAENYLETIGYKLAFSTKTGTTLCKSQRYYLPRIHAGNSPKLPI
jgi:peptidoglycan/xylan/chitin deacetylase (PgdA/CDA1 family)